MVIRTTTRAFVIALAAALLAACASGAQAVRPASGQSAAVVHAIPTPANAFANDDADDFWDNIGNQDPASIGYVENPQW
jgi:hypothetical protein